MDALLCITENTVKILEGLSGFLVVAIILIAVYVSKHKKRQPAEWRSKSGPIEKESDTAKKSKHKNKNKKESSEANDVDVINSLDSELTDVDEEK